MKRFKGHLTSENFAYHIRESVPICESIFRHGSLAYLDLIKEAREAYEQGFDGLCEEDIQLFQESDFGKFGVYGEAVVPLDCPLIEEVELDSPKRGGSKKFYVYVKDKDGEIKKIEFGDTSGLKVKFNDEKRRRSYVARHKCHLQKDKTTASYWSCQLPKFAKSLGMSGGGDFFW